MSEPPVKAQQNQQANDDAGAFVKVDEITPGRCVAWNVTQPPAKNKLDQQQDGNEPVQHPGSTTIARLHTLDLPQAGYVVRQIFNISITQGLRHTGHVAGIIGACARLEIVQLLDDVVVLLACDFRYFVLSGKTT